MTEKKQVYGSSQFMTEAITNLWQCRKFLHRKPFLLIKMTDPFIIKHSQEKIPISLQHYTSF